MQIYDLTKSLPRHPTAKYKQRLISAVTHVVVHHSGTTSGTPEAFARYHVETNDWPGIGYHYVIGRDGMIYKCHPASVISYHASGANSYSLGVCLVGNMDVQKPTADQMAALIELLFDLINGYRISPNHVIGHREVPGTRKSCPGANTNMDIVRAAAGAWARPQEPV